MGLRVRGNHRETRRSIGGTRFLLTKDTDAIVTGCRGDQTGQRTPTIARTDSRGHAEGWIRTTSHHRLLECGIQQ